MRTHAKARRREGVLDFEDGSAEIVNLHQLLLPLGLLINFGSANFFASSRLRVRI